MTRLNDAASRVLVAANVRACTDVTGFGLLGHLHRMLRASGVSALLDAGAVPLLPGALRLADEGFVPGGSKRNQEAVSDHVAWPDATELTRAVLTDAQTSGGLLAAVPRDRVDVVLDALDGELAHVVIGAVTDGAAGTIAVSGDVAATGGAR
jgi:selenide,water dikinase